MQLRALAALVLFMPFLGAQQPAQPATQPTPQPTTSVGPTTGTHYTNSSGRRVHTPVKAPSAPSGATAKCGDGTYSLS
jgi:hypothetical protein